MCLQLQGTRLLLIDNLSGIRLRMLKKLDQECAEMEAKVDQARKTRATAEQNRDANEKALAEARSHFH